LARATFLRVFTNTSARAQFITQYDSILRIWPVAFTELDVPTRFGITHVIASGPVNAPAIVLLPGMLATATMWRANVDALSREYRTFAVDTIGEPNKSVPTRRIWTRRGYAAWLTDLLDALSVRRAHFVGHSYGGFLALNQASLSPERVDRVVMINPAATIAPIWPFYRHLAIGLVKKRHLFEWMTNGVSVDPLDAGWGALTRIVAASGRILPVVPPRVFRRAELRRIQAPALLLIGDKEVIYDPEAALRRAREAMPTLRGAIVAGGNHLATMTAAAEVNRRMLEFLGERSTVNLLPVDP